MLSSVRVVKHGLSIVRHHSPQDTHHQEKARAYLHSLNKNKHELFFKYNCRSLSHTVGEGWGREMGKDGVGQRRRNRKVVALVSTGKDFCDIQETVTTFLVYNID